MLGFGRSVSRFVSSQKLELAKRGLERDLATIISLMEGHKQADLPVGHKYYGLLLTRAQKTIETYHTRATELGATSGSWDDVALGVPMLLELEHQAQGKPMAASVMPKVLAGFVVGLAGTVALALYHNVYVYLSHWVR